MIIATGGSIIKTWRYPFVQDKTHLIWLWTWFWLVKCHSRRTCYILWKSSSYGEKHVYEMSLFKKVNKYNEPMWNLKLSFPWTPNCNTTSMRTKHHMSFAITYKINRLDRCPLLYLWTQCQCVYYDKIVKT